MLTNKINPIERIQKIAMTGDISEPKPLTPVENIMQHYPNVQTTEENKGGFWNGLKNFASSNGGRMLLGGLGTAGLVGLTGGKLGDALSYGVVGAGNTADNLYKQEQDRKAWEEKEADRLFRQQESALNRQHNWDIANARIEADIQARKDAFERQKELLGLGLENEIEKLKAVDNYKIQQIESNPYLTDEQKQFQIKKLSGYDDDAYYTNLYYNGTPEEQTQAIEYMKRKEAYEDIKDPLRALKNASGIAKDLGLTADVDALNRGEIIYKTKPEKTSEGLQAYDLMIKNGLSPEEALISSGLNKLGYNVTMAERELANSKELEEQKTQNSALLKNLDYLNTQTGKEADLRRSMELERFKKSLPTEEQRDIEYQASVLGIPASDIYNAMHDERKIKVQQALENLRKTGADIDYANARTNLANRQAENVKDTNTPNFSNVQTGVEKGIIAPEIANKLLGEDVFQQAPNPSDKKYAEEQAKNRANQERAREQVASMMPRVMDAIDRAYSSLNEGTGLGQIGGWGWTTNKGGINRANIQNAQAQINTLMRGILSTLGVGATEMNSAAEAAAYRYMIDPAMPEAQIRQVLDNFKHDYASGTLMSDLQSVASAYNGQGNLINNQPTTYNVGGFTIERIE